MLNGAMCACQVSRSDPILSNRLTTVSPGGFGKQGYNVVLVLSEAQLNGARARNRQLKVLKRSAVSLQLVVEFFLINTIHYSVLRTQRICTWHRCLAQITSRLVISPTDSHSVRNLSQLLQFD